MRSGLRWPFAPFHRGQQRELDLRPVTVRADDAEITGRRGGGIVYVHPMTVDSAALDATYVHRFNLLSAVYSRRTAGSSGLNKSFFEIL